MIQNQTSKLNKQEFQPQRNKLTHHSLNTNLLSQLNVSDNILYPTKLNEQRGKEQSKSKKQFTVHRCQVIEGHYIQDPIHKKNNFTQPIITNNKTESFSIKSKSFKKKRESVQKQKENAQRSINLIKNKRAETAVLRQKINQNTVLQQKYLGRKSCKFNYQQRLLNRNFKNHISNNLLTPYFIENKGKQKNIIEIRECITSLFEEPIKTSTENSKLKKVILSQDSSLSFEDSVQYLEEKMPGPGQYHIGQRRESDKRNKFVTTFGKQERFKNTRPVTALQQYSIGFVSTKNKDNLLEHVAFGTSKFIPRSEVKKIEYCDWNRPHFYQSANNLEAKNLKQDPIYASTQQRFKDPENVYCWPDFYNHSSKLDKNMKNGMPNYYFISDVPKGLQFPDQDNRDFYNSIEKQKIKKKIHPERKKQEKQKIQMVKQVQSDELEERKKSIEQRGKLKRKKSVRKEQICNEKKLVRIEQDNIRQEKALFEKLGIHYRKRWEFSQDKWIKPSYNIKFQSKPTLFRL